ncbi:MAG: hypothetical protein AAF717_11590 [Bacteroidota bacterium]
MIKVFRKIRQQVLAESKFSRYLLYAIGEIILVVIGILIALQINSWKEKDKRLKQSDQALIELQVEVRTLKATLLKKNEVNLLATTIMQAYLEDQFINPSDSIKNRTVGYSFAYNPIQPYIPVIEREISVNHVIIGHTDLVKELQRFKDMHFALEQHRFYLDTYWNQQVIPYLKDQGQMLSFVSRAKAINKEIDGLEKLYDSEEFKNIVAMEYFFVKGYTDRIALLGEQLEKIDSMITKAQK